MWHISFEAWANGQKQSCVVMKPEDELQPTTAKFGRQAAFQFLTCILVQQVCLCSNWCCKCSNHGYLGADDQGAMPGFNVSPMFEQTLQGIPVCSRNRFAKSRIHWSTAYCSCGCSGVCSSCSQANTCEESPSYLLSARGTLDSSQRHSDTVYATWGKCPFKPDKWCKSGC